MWVSYDSSPAPLGFTLSRRFAICLRNAVWWSPAAWHDSNVQWNVMDCVLLIRCRWSSRLFDWSSKQRNTCRKRNWTV